MGLGEKGICATILKHPRNVWICILYGKGSLSTRNPLKAVRNHYTLTNFRLTNSTRPSGRKWIVAIINELHKQIGLEAFEDGIEDVDGVPCKYNKYFCLPITSNLSTYQTNLRWKVCNILTLYLTKFPSEKYYLIF